MNWKGGMGMSKVVDLVMKGDRLHAVMDADLLLNAIQRLKGNALAVYLTIAMGEYPGFENLTYETIAKICNIQKDTVGRAVKTLIEEGFIEKEEFRHGDGKFRGVAYRLKNPAK